VKKKYAPAGILDTRIFDGETRSLVRMDAGRGGVVRGSLQKKGSGWEGKNNFPKISKRVGKV